MACYSVSEKEALSTTKLAPKSGALHVHVVKPNFTYWFGRAVETLFNLWPDAPILDKHPHFIQGTNNDIWVRVFVCSICRNGQPILGIRLKRNGFRNLENFDLRNLLVRAMERSTSFRGSCFCLWPWEGLGSRRILDSRPECQEALNGKVSNCKTRPDILGSQKSRQAVRSEKTSVRFSFFLRRIPCTPTPQTRGAGTSPGGSTTPRISPGGSTARIPKKGFTGLKWKPHPKNGWLGTYMGNWEQRNYRGGGMFFFG